MCFEWLFGLLYDFMSSCIFSTVSLVWRCSLNTFVLLKRWFRRRHRALRWRLGISPRLQGAVDQQSLGRTESLQMAWCHRFLQLGVDRQNSKEHEESWKDIAFKAVHTNGEALVNSEALQCLHHKSFWNMYEEVVNEIHEMKWTQVMRYSGHRWDHSRSFWPTEPRQQSHRILGNLRRRLQETQTCQTCRD